MRNIIVSESYRVSQRVVVNRGDKFKATGGPYWKLASGEKIPLTSKGPYTFHQHCQRGSTEWIECLDRNGAFAVLHLAGRRKRIDVSLVPRPYRITGKKRVDGSKKRR